MKKSALHKWVMSRYVEFVLDHRLAAFLLVLVLVGSFAAFIPRLKFDNTPDSFFLKDDPTLSLYERFKSLFQSDEYSLILLEAPESWTPEYVAQVRRLGDTLASLDHVNRVTHIANVREIRGQAGELEVGDYIPEGLDQVQVDAKRKGALTHPYYGGLFVSSDGRHLGMVVETEIIKGEVDYKIEFAKKARAILADPRFSSLNGSAVGIPILDADVRSLVGRESGLFGAIAFVLVGLGFLMVFRTGLGLILPLGIAGLSILISFGIMGLIGAPVSLLTPIIPSFMVSVGIGSCIFLATQFYTLTHGGLPVREAIVESFRQSGLACFTANFTTSMALIAFCTSPIAPVMQVGLVMGLGLFGSLTLTFLLLPLAFSLYRRPPRSESRQRMIAGRLTFLTSIGDFVVRRPGKVLLGFGVLLAVSAAGIRNLDTDYYYLGIFKESTPIRRDYSRVDAVLPASASIEILVSGGGMDAFKDPANLAKLAALEEAILAYDRIPVKTYSLADAVKEINQALHDGDPAFYRIPEDRNAVGQQLLLFESSGNDELTRLASRDYDVARLTVRVPNLSDGYYSPLMDTIRAVSTRLFGSAAALATGETAGPEHVPATSITGLVPMWMKISDFLTESQVRSLALASAVVTVVMMLLFRSILLGICMSLCNAFVISVVLGLMGWTGISLDPYTILIAGIALGMLDDDTIHFVRHVVDHLGEGADMPSAIRSAFQSAGQAVFYNTGVLALSFAAYAFSSIASLGKFGLLVGFTLTMGMVVEFFLTPSVLMALDSLGMFRKYKLQNVKEAQRQDSVVLR